VIHRVAAVVLVLAIPAVLTAHAVRWVTLDEQFYVRELAHYGVGRVTGLDPQQLREVARAFITYFTAPPQPLSVVVNTPAGPQPLFNAREIAHMEDVQLLMHRVFALGFGGLAVAVLSALALLIPDPARGARALARATAVGGAASALLVGLIAGLAVLDFRQIFLQFHFLSFSNDLWILDPRRDRLIQLFPTGFFFDAALRIGVLVVGCGLALAVASVGVLLATRRGLRRAADR
jgi:integral membrane protein (TIGR01906 family)